MSSWCNRPLEKEQINYAALDAYILLELYQKLNEKNKIKTSCYEIK